jgi:4-hydroxy-2-oxoheptanedioate aldolase
VRRTLAERLHADGPLYGLVVKMPAPAILELAGHVGFDFAVIDTEHGSADSGDLEHHLRAADSAGLESLVRVGGHNGIEVLRALDAGASGVIVPHVTTADEAAAAVAAAHYPPVGRRGLAVSTRAGGQGTSSVAQHVADALRATVVVAQIEDGDALPRIRAIASTTRLDAIFIGPTDLSISLGHPGEPEHPRVVAAIADCVDEIAAVGQARICVLVNTAAEAEEWRRRGASLILFTASGVLARAFAELSEALRDIRAHEEI